VVADGDEGVGRTAAWYKALRESDLSPTQTLVARTIADFAGPDGGRAFMSNATLGKACRLDTETVRRATRELRRKGWIISNREGPGDTRGRRYRLSIPSAAPVDNPSRPFASARSEPVDKRQTVRQTVRHSPPRPCASAHLDRALQTTELSSNEGSNEVVVATAPTTAPPVGDDPTTTTSSTTGTSQRQECPRHAGEPGGTFPDSGKPRCRPCRQSKPPDDARDGSPADPRSYPPDAKDLNDQFYGCKHPNCRCNHGRCVGGRMPFRRDGSGGDPCPDCEAAS
jgi:hypothetical protein